MRVIIIDNSRLVREAISQVFLSCGIDKSNIASVENCQDAAELLSFFTPDVLFIGDRVDDISHSSFLSDFEKQEKYAQLVILSIRNAYFDVKELFPSNQAKIITLEKPLSKDRMLIELFNVTGLKLFAPAPSPAAEKKTLENKQTAKQATVLIVDDESSNIDVTVGNLAGEYRMLAAKSASQALRIMESQHEHISLILSDIMMPEMNGYQFCEILKADDRFNQIPIIFITAKSEVTDMTKGFELGAVDYITKPIQGDILKARVKTHVTMRQQQRQLAEQVELLKENAKIKEDIEKITQHDLKGPLASILFHAEQIDKPNTAKAIKSTVNNVITMINRSLELYKIEQGTFTLRAKQTDLSKIVLDAINAGMVTGELKNISFNTEALETPAFAHVDPLLCVSVFNNLIKNAVEAAPFDSEIEIKTFNDSEGIFYFVCKNKGAIPKNIREELFNKYSTSNTKQGTGLGTYSAKLMVEAQNGEIYFDIIDEKSTIFTVKLPK